MKRYVSLLIVLAMIVTTFAGFGTFAKENDFVINFDNSPTGGGVPALVNTVKTTEFSYHKGQEVYLNGWFGGEFPDGTTMVFTIDDGPEHNITLIAAEEGVVNAIKGGVSGATYFTRFRMYVTNEFANEYNGKNQTLSVYAKRPDGEKVLLSVFVSNVEKRLTIAKPNFYEGDPIEISYVNAEGSSSDKLAIYKDTGAEQPPFGDVYQYAYIDGSGSVAFNDPDRIVATNNRTAVTEDKPGDYTVITYNGSIKTLEPGNYIAVVMSGDTLSSNIVKFEVVPFAYEDGSNGDYTVDLSTLVGASKSWSAHGYPDLVSVMLNPNNVTSLGLFDLSGFKAVEITYATDKYFIARTSDMTRDALFALMDDAVDVGYNEVYKNLENIIAQGDIVDAYITNPDGANWDKVERTTVIDLSDVDYKGNVWLSALNPLASTILLVDITFIANDVVEPEPEPEDPDFTPIVDADGTAGDYVLHVSYDEVKPGIVCGGVKDKIVKPTVASGTKEAVLWGWAAANKEIEGFSYSINGGEVVKGIGRYPTEDAVIAAGAGVKGVTDTTRFEIKVPVSEGTQVIRAYAEFKDGTHELFWLAVLTVGERSTYKDAGDTYPNTTTPDPVDPPVDPKPPVDETAPQFKASSAEGVIGDTIVIELSLLNNPGISGFNLRINYDQNKLELVSYEDTRLLGNRITAGQTIKQYPYPQVWSDLENTNVNGVFGKLTFKIKDDTAAIGTTDITITILDVTECLGVGKFNTVTDKFVANNGVVTISDINCDHVFGDWEYADENNHKHTCTADCGRTYYEAHAWDAGKVTKNATCDAEGEKTYTCTVCGGTKTEKIAATGHKWGAWTVTKAPTCTEAGEETRTCANDASHKETRAAAATGHKWGEWTTTVAPTCTEAGEETRTCANDANHKETREAAALGHDWDEGEVTTEPTCTEAGEKTYNCTRCDETKTEEVPATGHSFTNYVPNTDATVDEDATEIAECDHGCGETDVRPIEGTKLPAEPEDPNKPGNPTTSDVSMWIVAIALLSVAGVVVVMYYKKRTEA